MLYTCRMTLPLRGGLMGIGAKSSAHSGEQYSECIGRAFEVPLRFASQFGTDCVTTSDSYVPWRRINCEIFIMPVTDSRIGAELAAPNGRALPLVLARKFNLDQ